MKRKSAKQEARLRQRQAKQAARVEQVRGHSEQEKAQRPRPVSPEQVEAIKAHLERKAATERARATVGWVDTLTTGDEWRFGSRNTDALGLMAPALPNTTTERLSRWR